MKNRDFTAFTLNNTTLKELYKRVVNKIKYNDSLHAINTNLGVYLEPEDYANEAITVLYSKLSSGKANFTTFNQALAFCNKVAHMLLFRQHRDHTSVKSRTAKLIDIDSKVTDSNREISDLVSFEIADKSKLIETQIEEKAHYKAIIVYTDTNAKVININDLFEINVNSTLINLGAFLDELAVSKYEMTLRKFKINKNQAQLICYAILDYFDINYNIKHRKPSELSINELSTNPINFGSREKANLRKFKCLISR